MPGGVHAGVCACLGCVCVWLGACMPGGVNAWGCACLGGMHAWGVHGRWACVVGGVHGRGEGVCVAGKTITAAGGTHPTGINSCLFMIFQQQLL